MHSCALLVNGSLLCWGDNSNGQLGMASLPSALNPRLLDLNQGVLDDNALQHQQ